MLRTGVIGFVAGVLATLVFHQAAIWLLVQVTGFPFAPWNLAINDYGVPRVAALAFWAGVWGIPLALALARRPLLPGRWPAPSSAPSCLRSGAGR